MTTCPKCHYIRQPHDSHLHASLCPACGIAYDKWRARQESRSIGSDSIEETEDSIESDPIDSVLSAFIEIPARVDAITFWGRALTGCALLAWTLYFASHGVDWEIIGGSFLHSINLAFHEFGHVFFAPFGRFMMILGGSLFQVLLPFGLMFAFVFYQRDSFGGAVMLWWCGQSFVDVSPYIRDGMYRSLPLVGGGGEESHDWGNLLTMLDAVESAPLYGNISFGIGCIIMFIALAWAAYLLLKQYEHI